MKSSNKSARAAAIWAHITQGRNASPPTAAEIDRAQARAAERTIAAKSARRRIDNAMRGVGMSRIHQEDEGTAMPRLRVIEQIIRDGRRQKSGQPVCTIADGTRWAIGYLNARDVARRACGEVRQMLNRDRDYWGNLSRGIWGHRRMRCAAELRVRMDERRTREITDEIQTGVHGNVRVLWGRTLAECNTTTTRAFMTIRVRGMRCEQLQATTQIIAQYVPSVTLPGGRRVLDGVVTLGAHRRPEQLPGKVDVWSAAWITRPGRAIAYAMERGVILVHGEFSRHVCLDDVPDAEKPDAISTGAAALLAYAKTAAEMRNNYVDEIMRRAYTVPDTRITAADAVAAGMCEAGVLAWIDRNMPYDCYDGHIGLRRLLRLLCATGYQSRARQLIDHVARGGKKAFPPAVARGMGNDAEAPA